MEPSTASLCGEDLKLLLSALQALKKGDFSARMPADWTGLAGKVADTMNEILEANEELSREITGVSRIVGREGRLEQRACVPGATGGWGGMVRSVNTLIDDLARPTTEMARVIGAVAKGDLSQTATLHADGRPLEGQFLQAAATVNTMVTQLSSFASEVTRVAREVGSEGKLGGQAQVPGVAGIWKDLTENLNRMAATLTTQVRAISEVATAVTRGDLSRAIQVETRGEVSYLKDNINEMIRNLKETTQQNAQQDWLKTNLARFTRLLQGQRDLDAVSALILSELAPLVYAQHGMFYRMEAVDDDGVLRALAAYGYCFASDLARCFRPGQGLVGQCAKEKQRILLANVPRDYLEISSGLGAAPPANIVVLPILFEQQVMAVIELASMERFTDTHLSFLDQLMESVGVVLNNIEASSRTESLLVQSQSLARELRQTNLDLAEKASQLSAQNIEVERKNREVEQAKRALEEKASQLALSSRYKSEFLANMSHELRTPLNSLLILAQQLADNPEGNLSAAQVEYAHTIHGSGSDLLALINDILDLSKIESGTVTLEMSEYRFDSLHTYVERTFRHMAEARNLAFSIELDPALPRAMYTDSMRLQQILKNLLSNAFKFTSRGKVALRIGPAKDGWSAEHAELCGAKAVLAFSVTDTGVGIAPDKLQLIFEAFQQADGSTARKYGGTGLGLSISRELARLLCGEIRVQSEPCAGSTFTLYLPQQEVRRIPHAASVAEHEEDGLPARVVLYAPWNGADGAWPSGTSAMSGDGIALMVDDDVRTGRVSLERKQPQKTGFGGAAGSGPVLLERLVADSTLFRQPPEASLPDASASGDASLAGRKVLIVDDDLRNIFALSSLLERQGMKVLYAENGRDGIEVLQADQAVDIVLMDIMMPGMDGYATMRAIRRKPEFRALPIIALTAKAMKGDREECIAAGASDYIAKPVDAQQLLSLLRGWVRNG
ncbi:MAG TPA: response regulator [Noviherbaspirillum sp.]|uniref:response regulator n=1 Tax=Noviherbaspirillum sp. TaxID=1926288 RepID=UPI002D3770C3|nr:response regulator [Noviherbaspirillum sp.]HYD94456.1 response regulator [Noviherbaspirillum sp.]